MKKRNLFYLFLIICGMALLAGCAKINEPPQPSSIVGTWSYYSHRFISYENGIKTADTTLHNKNFDISFFQNHAYKINNQGFISSGSFTFSGVQLFLFNLSSNSLATWVVDVLDAHTLKMENTSILSGTASNAKVTTIYTYAR